MTKAQENVGDNKSDQDLWNDILEGNIESLGILYKRYFFPLFAFGKKVTEKHDLAEDCVQDLFFKIWRKRKKLKKTIATRSYIYKAYRRLLIDRLIIANKELQLHISENLSQTSVQELIIKNEIDAEKILMIRKEIDKLPARQKEIIFLRFFNGLDYEEISEILDINYQSVRNSIHKGLTTIRKSIPNIVIYIYLSNLLIH